MKVLHWITDKLYAFVGALLVLIILSVLLNGIYEGYYIVVTQERIDDSYRIH